MEAVSILPLDRVMIETDAPYLAPMPYRGKRNESAYIVEVLRKIAYIYNVSEQEAENITNDNARRIFPRMNMPQDIKHSKKHT